MREFARKPAPSQHIQAAPFARRWALPWRVARDGQATSTDAARDGEDGSHLEARRLTANELAHTLKDDGNHIRRQEKPKTAGPTNGANPMPQIDVRMGVDKHGFPTVDLGIGMGSIINQTDTPFVVYGSTGRHGSLLYGILKRGAWGRDNPLKSSSGDMPLYDLDFVCATPTTPLNGATKGVFKIGQHTAVIGTDRNNLKNSLIVNFEAYGPSIKSFEK